jgi:D-sedoheptulose 7-phosphate isomerase
MRKFEDDSLELITILQNINNKLISSVNNVCSRMTKMYEEDAGTFFVFGNGGSAADAQHFCGELTGRYRGTRKALSSHCLNSDTSLMTCIANDFGYDVVFKRQLQASVKACDIVMGISTSGTSQSVILALEYAKSIGSYTILLTSEKCPELVNDKVDEVIRVASTNTARIQEIHIFLIHHICEAFEDE